jgi:hypothetical protein
MGYNITQRLAVTIANIKYQKGQCFWDDMEKLELILDRLKEMELCIKNQEDEKIRN